MTLAIYHHMAIERHVDIVVKRNGPTYVVELDTPGRGLITVLMTREQLLALHAASSIALTRPEEAALIGSEKRNGSH